MDPRRKPTNSELLVGHCVLGSLLANEQVLRIGQLVKGWQVGYDCQNRQQVLADLMSAASIIAMLQPSPVGFMLELLERIRMNCKHALLVTEAEVIASKVKINSCGDTVRSWGR